MKGTVDPWFFRHFSEEVKLRYASSRWDVAARPEDELPEDLLEEDDELNKTDVPTLMRAPQRTPAQVEFQGPDVSEKGNFPSMYKDSDSVSTFHLVTPGDGSSVSQPSITFQPRVLLAPYARGTQNNIGIPTAVDEEQLEVVSKISDNKSRISSLESQFKALNSSLNEKKKQPMRGAKKNARRLQSMLALLEGGSIQPQFELTVPSDQARKS